MPRQRRKIVNLIKTGTLDQMKYRNRMVENPRRLGKINKISTKQQMNFKREIMPGSGAGSYTNYQLNPKSNPYLALVPVNIAGYNLNQRNAKQATSSASHYSKRRQTYSPGSRNIVIKTEVG